MTKKQMAAKAKDIMERGTFDGQTGDAEWQNNFYKVNGFLVNIQYHNGKLYEIIRYGR